MSGIKAVRDYFGWSQETLAHYLSVSRSLVKLAERGERYLPSLASIKLVGLQQFAFVPNKAAEGASDIESVLSTQKESKKLHRLVNRYEVLTEKSRQQLADARQRYKQAQNSLAVFRHLHPDIAASTDKEGKKDTIWLNIIEANAKVQLQRYSPAVQALLQWKIDCYVYAAQRAKELGEK